MLADEYYIPGARQQSLKDIMKRFSGVIERSRDIKELSYDIIKKDLMLEEVILSKLNVLRPDLLKYLLPWSSSSVIISRHDVIRIKFPCLDGLPIETTQTYELDARVFGNFWFHKMYTVEADYEAFEDVEILGGGDFKFELPAQRSTLKDGQMKIVVDAVIAVDALPSLEKQKIVCVGTSGPGTVVSGLAYEAIALMLRDSEIYMYDPHEVPAVYVDGNNNKIRRFRSKYEYPRDRSIDLILDDAWERGVPRNDRDPNGNACLAKNFSIKCFDISNYPVENRYYQAFSTDSFEHRLVSRKVEFNYRYHNLGKCGACTELKYFMRRQYSPEFYDFIMKCHGQNCNDRSMRIIGTAEFQRYNFIEIEPIAEIFLKNFFCLSWDDFFQRSNHLPLNVASIRGAYVKVSDDRYLINLVLAYAKCIIKISDNRFFVIGDPDLFGFKRKEIFLSEDFTVKKVKEMNVSKNKNRSPTYGERGRRKKKC